MQDFRSNLILKEIEIIQNKIDNFDEHSLIIKGWAITLWSAIWLWAINQWIENPNNSIEWIIIIGVVAVIFFWLFDSLFKFYQRAFIVRTKQIESYLNNIKSFKKYVENNLENALESSIKIFNPTGEKSSEFQNYQNLLRCFFLRYVCTLYFALEGISFVGIYMIFNSSNSHCPSLILGIIFLILTIIFLIFGHDKTFDRIANKFNRGNGKEKLILQKTTLNKLKKIEIKNNKNYDSKINFLYEFYQSNKEE